MQQLELPLALFGTAVPTDALNETLDWLINTRGCTPYVEPYVVRLFSEFGKVDAIDRCVVFPTLCGQRTVEGWCLEDAEYIGIYDHSITDHSVIWDRHWAIQMLVPRELVPKVWKCGYGGLPKFWDKEGNLLYQSVYMHDGKILTREERRAALAGGVK